MSLAKTSDIDQGLPLSHLALAIAIMAVWGTNFVIIEVGLKTFPPLLFATLRFVFVLFPGLFFIKRPSTPLRKLVTYGVLIGAGQFGLLYIALRGFIYPGLASIVVQSQVFFTILMSIVLLRERVKPLQWAAMGLAAAGLAVIAIAGGGEATAIGIVLILLAGLSWASANLMMKGTASKDMLGYVIWGSLFSIPPLLLLSLFFDGPQAIVHAVQTAGVAAWSTVLWQAVGNSLFGFAAWGWLLSRHPAPVVAPTALLVPIFGLLSASLWLGERLEPWKIVAAALVMAGLGLNLLATRPKAAPSPSTL